MPAIYALREIYLAEKLHVVLFLDPELLAEALERLERGEVKKAVDRLSEAATVYLGEVETPVHELYCKLREAGDGWQGLVDLAELGFDEERLEEDLEDYEAPTAVYPVLTGLEGLTLLLAVDAWHPEAGDIEAYALAHLDPELLPRRSS